jgi:rhodanese-related sulfurtransferase
MNAFLNFFSNTEEEYKTVECGTLEQLIQENGYEGVNLIDVRTEMEHMSGHIPNSVNINLMNPQFVSRLQELDKQQPYYVYCASGNRSRTACSQMKNMGFQEVYNVKMGMMGWSGEIA